MTLLSRREREIMDVLFALGGEAAAEEIRERLSNPPTSSACRAMLTKLELKGAIRHREQGLRYVYSATTARRTARRSALRQIVDVFFEGSKSQVVTALLEDEKWTAEELDELGKNIEKALKDKKS